MWPSDCSQTVREALRPLKCHTVIARICVVQHVQLWDEFIRNQSFVACCLLWFPSTFSNENSTLELRMRSFTMCPVKLQQGLFLLTAGKEPGHCMNAINSSLPGKLSISGSEWSRGGVSRMVGWRLVTRGTVLRVKHLLIDSVSEIYTGMGGQGLNKNTVAEFSDFRQITQSMHTFYDISLQLPHNFCIHQLLFCIWPELPDCQLVIGLYSLLKKKS